MRIPIRKLLITFTSMAALVIALIIQAPEMAMARSSPSITPTVIATMSDKVNAKAKETQGKLESAYGELSGDAGHKLKGQAKQVQASAMKATEAVKDKSRDMARKTSDASDKLADKIK